MIFSSSAKSATSSPFLTAEFDTKERVAVSPFTTPSAKKDTENVVNSTKKESTSQIASDVLPRVFSFLGESDVASAVLVCRSWKGPLIEAEKLNIKQIRSLVEYLQKHLHENWRAQNKLDISPIVTILDKAKIANPQLETLVKTTIELSRETLPLLLTLTPEDLNSLLTRTNASQGFFQRVFQTAILYRERIAPALKEIATWDDRKEILNDICKDLSLKGYTYAAIKIISEAEEGRIAGTFFPRATKQLRATIFPEMLTTLISRDMLEEALVVARAIPIPENIRATDRDNALAKVFTALVIANKIPRAFKLSSEINWCRTETNIFLEAIRALIKANQSEQAIKIIQELSEGDDDTYLAIADLITAFAMDNKILSRIIETVQQFKSDGEFRQPAVGKVIAALIKTGKFKEAMEIAHETSVEMREELLREIVTEYLMEDDREAWNSVNNVKDLNSLDLTSEKDLRKIINALEEAGKQQKIAQIQQIVLHWPQTSTCCVIQ